jgi:uncharacterized protein (DUF433 family)
LAHILPGLCLVTAFTDKSLHPQKRGLARSLLLFEKVAFQGQLADGREFCEVGIVKTKLTSMKSAAPESILGKGIYTVPDASRLSGVSARRIRYWLKGLPSEDVAESASRRLWHGELTPIDDKFALGFLDLQEVRFIDAFLKAGVTWPHVRRTHDTARERYRTEHPFCTRRFVTDGGQILEEISQASGESALEEVVCSQLVFRQVVQPFLKELEFTPEDQLVRWWPLGIDRSVVLDPNRQFGQPIVARGGVATEVLEAAAKAGQSVEEIAQWYEIDPTAVRDAIDFETALAA